jgi:hypothetical protein
MFGRRFVYIIVPAIALLVAAGCVEREPDKSVQSESAHDAETSETEPTPTPEFEPAASYESLEDNPCSWAEVSDPAPSEPFEDLAWKSHQVLVGKVVEEVGPAWMEPDDRHSGRPGQCLQIMTDYFVEIETHYRGEQTDPLRVRIRGGEIDDYEQSTDVSPELEVGDRLLMFMREATESEVLPDAWLAIGNRVWHVSDDNRVHGDEWLDDFEVLDLENVDQCIRDVLGRQSHILGTRNVTDEESPIHVERDNAREPIVGTPCSFAFDLDYEPHPPVEELTWGSGQIVVATVIDDHGPNWAEPDNVDSLGGHTRGCLEIMNDYEIEVEQQFFGDPADRLRIRGPGGELDGYEQRHGVAPDLEPGDRYLFFLFKAPKSEILQNAWAFDVQRARKVRAGEVIATGHDSSMTLDEVAALVEETLAGDPPPPDEVHRALWGSANSPQFVND